MGRISSIIILLRSNDFLAYSFSSSGFRIVFVVLASSLMVTAEMLLLLRNCKDGIHWVESVNRVIEECRAASERRFRQTMKVEGRKNNCVGPTAMVEHSHTPTFPSKPRVHSTS